MKKKHFFLLAGLNRSLVLTFLLMLQITLNATSKLHFKQHKAKLATFWFCLCCFYCCILSFALVRSFVLFFFNFKVAYDMRLRSRWTVTIFAALWALEILFFLIFYIILELTFASMFLNFLNIFSIKIFGWFFVFLLQ